VGPHRYKRSYTRPGFTQTDYGTNAGLYRSGEQNWAAQDEFRIPINLLEPLPDLRGSKDFTFEKADFTGDVKLRCIVLAHSNGANPVAGVTFPTFCIDPETPVLRLSVPYGASTETIYNRIQVFQNHYVAGQLIINIRGKTVFKLAVDSLERLQDPDNAMFTPPSDAVLLPPGPIPLRPGSLQILKSVAPMYPALAKAQRYEGTVIIWITVDGSGHVAKAKVIDGPRMLQQAALDAVSQSIYRPFLVSGEPVEVVLELRVIFNEGR
jgi:TonB family protein